MRHRRISATEFKAKCLALLDEVEGQGIRITVTKRGRPVATVGPARRRFKSLKGILAGKVFIPDDILEADRSELWNVVHGFVGGED